MKGKRKEREMPYTLNIDQGQIKVFSPFCEDRRPWFSLSHFLVEEERVQPL